MPHLGSLIGREVRQAHELPVVDRSVSPLLRVDFANGGSVPSFSLWPGEILGFAGFVGAGRSHLARAIVGMIRSSSVTVTLSGVAQHFRSPRHAIEHGVVYLTEDRKRDGLFANLPIVANATAAALDLYSRFGLILKSKSRHDGTAMLKRLRVVAPSLDAPVRELSGGNQQKTMFGRALLCRPAVLICDEPTRSVDVGARDEIYGILIELACQGVGIVVISSEVKELMSITHRILVMRDRAIVRELETKRVDEEEILMAATGGAD